MTWLLWWQRNRLMTTHQAETTADATAALQEFVSLAIRPTHDSCKHGHWLRYRILCRGRSWWVAHTNNTPPMAALVWYQLLPLVYGPIDLQTVESSCVRHSVHYSKYHYQTSHPGLHHTLSLARSLNTLSRHANKISVCISEINEWYYLHSYTL